MSRHKKLINNSGIPQHEIENIDRVLLPDILAFYESEEGQWEFAEWKAAQDGIQTVKDKSKSMASAELKINLPEAIYTHGDGKSPPPCSFT